MELNAVGAFVGGCLGLGFTIAIGADAAAAGLRSAAQGVTSPTAALVVVAASGFTMLGAMAGGIGASVVQTGGFAPRPLKMQFDKMAPTEGFKRMFSRESAISAARALLAIFVCTLILRVSILSVSAIVPEMEAPGQLALIARDCLIRIVVTVLAIGCAFSAVDLLVVRAQWLRRLRMDFFELKRDAKEQMGDPHLRAKRKSRHASLSRAAIARTAEASFVVANPTHIAIALLYRPPSVAVPRVLVRAAEASALRVRDIAAEAGIPVIENVPLARALWSASEPGRPIPRDLFVAVAEIVANLMSEGALA